MRAVTVFCASSDGKDARWRAAAYDAGAELARRGLALVYGGGGRGLMGAVAQGALDHGGDVVGVIPQFMVEREWGRADLTELLVVETMHQRKAIMYDRGEAVLCLPGGLGTLEELVEIWSWQNLDVAAKPICLLDVGGFWQPLLDLTEHLVDSGLMDASAAGLLSVQPSIEGALDALAAR